jgi:nicotinamidase-related amidase
MANKALLVIDVQEGLFADENIPVFNGERLLNNIGELIAKARKTNVPIIFVRHGDDFLQFGTDSWHVHKNLDSRENDIYVNKKTPDSFLDTNLLEALKLENIDKVFICGLQTEFCVDTTCRSAFSKKLEIVLVEDAHSTYDSAILNAEQIIDHHNGIIGGSFAKLSLTKDVSF